MPDNFSQNKSMQPSKRKGPRKSTLDSGSSKASSGDSFRPLATRTTRHLLKKPVQGPDTTADSLSGSTVSVQQLQFPEDFRQKPGCKVPPSTDGEQEKDLPKACLLQMALKSRGPLQPHSSTNSHFEGLVMPMSRKVKCTPPASITTPLSSPGSTWSSGEGPRQGTHTSRNLDDSQHAASVEQVRLQGMRCDVSCVRDLIKPYVGVCPPNYSKLARMSKGRQKFFLTQDPRKTYCLKNPEAKDKEYSVEEDLKLMTKLVKEGDNVWEGNESNASTSSFICDVIDVENPMQLDFQGLDYKNTYENDEQDVENQRLYRQVCRFMDRKRIKADVEVLVEEELQAERLAIPSCFAVQDRNEVVERSPTPEPIRHGKLFRSEEKPYNKERIIEEHENRRQRYKNLYLRRKERSEKQAKEKQEQNKDDELNKALSTSVKQFDAVLATIEERVQHTKKTEEEGQQLQLKETVEPRTFPHTMRETKQFKKKLKRENIKIRDTFRIKQEFFEERLGKEKFYPEAELEISNASELGSQESPQISEQSSDDEDDMEVGQQEKIFKLRGFHYKLGDNIRGKRHRRQLNQGTRKEKGCKTREQWLAELAPKKEHIRLDVEEGITKIKSPDDPNLKLFVPKFGFKPPEAKFSAVRNYMQKRLGRHYDRITRKRLKMLKPRLQYRVKKFNLISFLYDDADRMLQELKKANADDGLAVKKPTSTLEYIKQKERLGKIKHERMRSKRLKLLGIPWHEVKKSRLQTLCENSSSSSDSDWVPEQEEVGMRGKSVLDRRGVLPLHKRGNMPAPHYRETTLRRHPRRPRNYMAEQVPSALFDEAVKQTGIPHMLKLKPDEMKYANIHNLRKTKYTELFDARHHHDHWDPTQMNSVNVHHQAKLVRPQVTQVKSKKDRLLMENFQKAHPPSNAYADQDLTIDKFDFKPAVDQFIAQKKLKIGKTADEKFGDNCEARDFVFHSRPPGDLENIEYPGRDEYLAFINEIREQLRSEVKEKKEEGPQLLSVDKEAIVKELEEDLKSIESCITSLSSSECTNMTNDSGSFLLMEGTTKVPLDYIRKSVIPFEELQRSRFYLDPIDVEAEDANPFKVLPFSGQKKAQAAITTAKDSFFTFNTRLQNGLRLRLEVPVEDVRKKLLGRGDKKFPGLVTTDIDENYVTELKKRPPVKMFNFKTGANFIKDALRFKFESMLIQGQIVRNKIYDRLNEQHWENMQRSKALYEKLFVKWQKREYESAMSVVHQVKKYYEQTDNLKKEFRELERQQVILNMDIVFIEGHWIRRIMLQNFHYLLADQDWRIEHDWIHRVEGSETELESFEESIAKRNTVNIRAREKDDAWAIKTFYEEVYLKNQHPILIVFPDAESFIKGIENLKMKTFVLLLELHFTLSIHTELQARLETFEEWCSQDLKDKEEYVSRKCAKLYFMTYRAEELKRRTLDFLDEPIEVSFNDEQFIKDRAVISEVFRQIVPAQVRGSSDSELDPIDMVAMMSDVVVELIGKFESIPVEKAKRIETALRRRRAHERKLSYQAYQVEKRIESEMKKVRKNLEPPYKKPKRVGKLPRIHIKKHKKSIVVEEKRISEHTRFFFKAFHDSSETLRTDNVRESLLVVDTIQEHIVPFYFDHFLKLNGYTPNYNFKTHVETVDGLEQDRFKVRSIVPDCMEKLERWEVSRRKIMEENISRNPKMYENLNF